MTKRGIPSGPYPNNLFNRFVPPEVDAQIIERMRANPGLFIQTYLKIRKKKDEPVHQIVFNTFQKYLTYRIQERRKAGLPLFFIICKARQVGVSTFTEAMLFWRARLFENSNCLVVGNSNDTAETVLEMAQLFLDELPLEIAPIVGRRSKSMIRFENPNEQLRREHPGLRSTFRIATARNPEIGRSKTLHGVHLTEFPLYRDPDSVYTSVMNAVADDPNTLVFIEGTPNGADNAFYHLFMASRKGKTSFSAEFCPFWLEPTYSIPLKDEERDFFEASLDSEERQLQKEVGPSLTLEKLNFRRWAIDNKCRSSVVRFNADYAPTLKKCFVARGEGIFDMNAVSWYMSRTKPGKRCIIRRDRMGRPYLTPDKNGYLTVWKEPQKGESYVMGVDGSMGVAREYRKEETDIMGGGDYSAAEVFSVRREQVAEFRTNVYEPFEVADLVALLGAYYNMCMINPEVGGANSSGYALQFRLKDIGYPKIARWVKWDGPHNQEFSKFVGMEATTKTVPIFNAEIMYEVRRGAGLVDPMLCQHNQKCPRMILYSSALLDECSNYALHAGGGVGARAGHHDDLVRASALALIALHQLPPPRSPGDPHDVIFTGHGSKAAGIQPVVPGCPGWLLT